jgi:hypothetical protein
MTPLCSTARSRPAFAGLLLHASATGWLGRVLLLLLGHALTGRLVARCGVVPPAPLLLCVQSTRKPARPQHSCLEHFRSSNTVSMHTAGRRTSLSAVTAARVSTCCSNLLSLAAMVLPPGKPVWGPCADPGAGSSAVLAPPAVPDMILMKVPPGGLCWTCPAAFVCAGEPSCCCSCWLCC